MAREGEHVWAAKGKKVVKIDLGEGADDDELVAVMIGPSGKLRAPAMRVGSTFVVGFNADMFGELFE